MAPRPKHTTVRGYLRRIIRRRRRPTRRISQHYLAHKETAREELTARVHYWNEFYQFSYNRIAIRNQRRRWGSCSSLRNLNFNYKLILLPTPLQDYVVVHELCHLKELNHSVHFWNEVAKTIPDYHSHITQLRHIEHTYGTSIKGLTAARAHYQARTITPTTPHFDAETSAHSTPQSHAHHHSTHRSV